MKTKFLLIACSFCLVNFASRAAAVTVRDAQTVAVNYFALQTNLANVTAALKYTGTEANGSVDFYVFNMSPQTGFVIVSAYDNVEPVLAYSNESYFNVDVNQSSGVTGWMKQVAAKISTINQLKLQADDNITGLWTAYRQGIQVGTSRSTSVAPLLTTQWGQENYISATKTYLYNALCPYNSTDKQRCVTGCVATAMAQLMKFWNFPTQGIGNYSYNCSPSNTTTFGFANYTYNYGQLSANFGATTYQWTEMPDVLNAASSSYENSAISTLMYQCGVSVAMAYEDDHQGSSGAYMNEDDLPAGDPCTQNALSTYFGYDASTMQGVPQSTYTNSWPALLEGELNAGRPVMYQGGDQINSTTITGHVWICDGYNTSGLFHMNWGITGFPTGYFNLNNLNPAQYVFNYLDEVLIGIQPNITSACAQPTQTTNDLISSTAVVFNWEEVPGAIHYNLRFRQVRTPTWDTHSFLNGTYFFLFGLTPGAEYEWQVQTVCATGVSEFTPSTVFTAYCLSSGSNTSYEYIDEVQFRTITQVSDGNNTGYEEYTNDVTNVTAGSSHYIRLTPGFPDRQSYDEYWTVYIDYNRNGVFTDPGEMVFEGNGTGLVTSPDFTVPTNAATGLTRMRIQMQRGAYETDPCANFESGDVQDYTLNIVPANSDGDNNFNQPDNAGNMDALILYPNPAQEDITVQFNASNDNNIASFSIYNLVGQKLMKNEIPVVEEGANIFSVNTGGLSSGTYIFEIANNGDVQRTKFVIAK